MEYRKVILFGKSSYVLSLPKKWMDENKLGKGSQLCVDVSRNSLLISAFEAAKKEPKKEISIYADNKTQETIETEIITAYLNDYDIIEVHSKHLNEVGESIKSTIMDLAGMEILEQTSTKIMATYLIDINEISFSSLIRRMDNITRSLIEDGMECINGICSYDSIRKRDRDVNRLNFLLKRTAKKALTSRRFFDNIKETQWDICTCLVVAERIEKISDRQKRIARHLEHLKMSKTFKELLFGVYKNIALSYNDVMKSYYNKDKKSALGLENENREKTSACDNLLRYDMKKSYVFNKTTKSDYIREEMLIADIAGNLKAMSTSIKMIAREVLNN